MHAGVDQEICRAVLPTAVGNRVCGHPVAAEGTSTVSRFPLGRNVCPPPTTTASVPGPGGGPSKCTWMVAEDAGPAHPATIPTRTAAKPRLGSASLDLDPRAADALLAPVARIRRAQFANHRRHDHVTRTHLGRTTAIGAQSARDTAPDEVRRPPGRCCDGPGQPRSYSTSCRVRPDDDRPSSPAAAPS